MAHIMCINCKYASVDKSASIGGWTAYECTNSKSEYYRALLNIDINGKMQKRISWKGCRLGMRRNQDETLSKTSVQDRT